MKLYKREGRRFVEVQNTTGMYYQENGTFQKERDENSVGICVGQTYDTRTVVLFESFCGNWEECKKFCKKRNGYMPTRIQLSQLKPSFITNNDLIQTYYWTQEECDFDLAWTMCLRLGPFFGRYTSDFKLYGTYKVLAFVDIPI